MNWLTRSQVLLSAGAILCGLLILAYETGVLNLEVVPSLIARSDAQQLFLKKDGKIRHVYPKSIIELSNGVVGRFSQVIAGKIVVESVSGEILAVRPDEVSIVRSLQPNMFLTGYIAGLIGFGLALKSTEQKEAHSGCGGTYYVYTYDPRKALPPAVGAAVLGGALAYSIRRGNTYTVAPGEWELVIE